MFDSLVTFSDIPSKQEYDDSLVHMENPQVNLTIAEPLYSRPSIHPYTFNPDIYRSSTLSIPRNILRTISENQSKYVKDLSVRYHMPNWNHFEFNPSQQKEFVIRYFPEWMGLYKKYTNDEERNNLFVYLWMYINGGVYISSDYELLKSIEDILDTNERDKESPADLYFMFDDERYISPKFFGSQPFCGFWMEAVNLMDKRAKYKYPLIREEIDRNTGRGLLTDVCDETRHKFQIIPRLQLDPYSPCDIEYIKDSYLYPSNRNQDFITYMSCQTGSSTELIYITGAIVLIISMMIIIALITN